MTWIVALAAHTAFAAARPPQEPNDLDLGCIELREQLKRELPMVRKKRVEVSACARLPGFRAVVVLRTLRGSGGDPLEVADAPDRQRLATMRTLWTREPLMFVADRGDLAATLRDALAPIPVDLSMVHPGALAADVVVHQDHLPDPRAGLLAAALLDLELRFWTPATWAVAREGAAETLSEVLGLSSEETSRLMDHGVVQVTDLISLQPEALASAVRVEPSLALRWTDDAAWWVERTSAPHPRGW